MIKGRSFKNKFAEKLNYCAENDSDGIYPIFLRFKMYLDSIDSHIEETNNKILKEVENESNDIKLSILFQPDYDNKLNYFKGILFKSYLVSIYSYFDSKLAQIANICEEEPALIKYKTIKSYKKGISENGNQITLSDIEQNKNFLENEIISDLRNYSSDFETLILWKDIRNYITHHKSIEILPKAAFLTENSMEIKYNELVVLDKKGLINFSKICENYLENIIILVNIKYDLIKEV